MHVCTLLFQLEEGSSLEQARRANASDLAAGHEVHATLVTVQAAMATTFVARVAASPHAVRVSGERLQDWLHMM